MDIHDMRRRVGAYGDDDARARLLSLQARTGTNSQNPLHLTYEIEKTFGKALGMMAEVALEAAAEVEDRGPNCAAHLRRMSDMLVALAQNVDRTKLELKEAGDQGISINGMRPEAFADQFARSGFFLDLPDLDDNGMREGPPFITEEDLDGLGLTGPSSSVGELGAG